MKKNLLVCTFIIFISFTTSAKSNDSIIVFNDLTLVKELNYNLFKYEDSLSNQTFEKILHNNFFTPTSFSVPNFGVSKSTFWLKFSIQNQTNEDKLLLQLAYPLIDIADLYCINKNNTYTLIEAGDTKPFVNRKYKNQNFIYDIILEKNETKTFLLKIKGTEQIVVPLYLGTKEKINESNASTDIFVGMFIGIILVMFIYNLFIYLTVRDINYLYYIIYILFIGLTQITLLGYSNRLLWPQNLWLSNHALYIVASVGSSAIAIFMYSFLNMKKYTPKLVYGVYLVIGIYILAIITAISENQTISYNLIDINGMILSFFALFVAIKITTLGYKPALYFLIGWTIFLIGGIVFILRNFGILPYNNFTNYTMPAGSAIEVTLLSLALANRINIFKKEKEASQKLALETLKENERIIREQNVILESKVIERTTKLEETITNLKQTQSKLVDAEKMASLGQLTAGIAHEINNPINFVVSSVPPLKRDIADLYELISLYDSLESNPSLKNEFIKINNFKKEADIDYLKKEIDILLKGMEEGAIRTSDIVKSLRSFSRLDENAIKKVNLHEGIDSTLSLLNSKINGKIKIIKDYSLLPFVECYPGKINQVFMNIINNGIQAIESNEKNNENGILTITTINDDQNVYIHIKDNGIGMNEATMKKIFEPFFTTKDVGKGTGLGLSISYAIIEEHHGSIDLKSTLNEGTEFIISLPILYNSQ